MTRPVKVFPVVICAVVLFCIPSFAQTSPGRPADSTPQEQSPNVNSTDSVATEIGLLRKSLQTLNTRLREISEKVLTPDANRGGAPNDKPDRISLNLDLLTRAEQRAEFLRKELFDRIEKEASLKSRLVQIDEDMRPESIERALNPYGTTRTAELRDTRRRALENDRRGFESLLSQTTQSRMRLEDDVRQADAMVAKLRQRVLPLIDKEIEKINPNPN